MVDLTEEEQAFVLRKAMLLGFEAEEYDASAKNEYGNIVEFYEQTRWCFRLEGRLRLGYSDVYHAALEYLRLLNVPFVRGDHVKIRDEESSR